MKSLGILISESFFFGLASLGETRKGISHSISLFLTIINLKVVLRKLLGQADMTRAQALCIHVLTKIIMVNKNRELVFAAFQVVASSLERFNNG